MPNVPRTVSTFAAVVTVVGTVVAGTAGTASAAGGADATAKRPPVRSYTDVAVPGYAFRVIGERTLPARYRYAGVGGLSGIDYNAAKDRWYAISDDRSEHLPARFYTFDLDVTATGLGEPRVTDITLLKRPDGKFYPKGSVDPEAIRFDPAAGDLTWTSEGERLVPTDGTAPTLVSPGAYRSTTGGASTAELTQPAVLAASAGETGPRRNLALEGLTLSANGNGVITAMEGPLLQDGAEPTPTSGAPVRVTLHSKATGQPVNQLVYQLDPVPAASPTGGAASNGVTEILAVDNSHYLVLERAYIEGAGNSVRLYEMDIARATNVLNTPSLAGVTYTPTTKRLLVDFGAFGLGTVDNIEGMGWGPTLPNGERTLVLVSDDNFSSSQQTRFVALGVTLG
ncbi:esterase-like activity of phytase family protein [Micromonospora sp. NPDC049559]|uniref:esterase-like activity of phytase family protein n=1 Tax=Micromonospora sp. NPDC049559 TaxID=3155923 RepID=UPI00342C34E2